MAFLKFQPMLNFDYSPHAYINQDVKKSYL